MAFYLVDASGVAGATFKNGHNIQVVSADSSTMAKQIAAAKFDGDGSVWSGATVTELALGDWEGWTFTITIYTPTPKTFTYVGTATNDTIDEIAAQLVILLNADADIAGASYNSTTQVLTVAETTDGLGDMEIEVKITPPSGYSEVASLVGTIVDGGASGDALQVTLPADADVPPVSFVTARI